MFQRPGLGTCPRYVVAYGSASTSDGVSDIENPSPVHPRIGVSRLGAATVKLVA
jgi:hypothetical protein